MSTFVHVKGLDELQKFLDALPAKMEANVMRSALRAGAQVIAQEAKANVPVDTGRLRDSIRVTTRSRRGTVYASVKAGSKDTKKKVSEKRGGGISVSYENAWYAHFVEYGTAPHFIGTKFAKGLVLRSNKRATSGFAKRWMNVGVVVEGVHHPGSKAKPFMRPAMDSRAQAALLAVGNAIKSRLQAKHGMNTSDVKLETA